MSDSTTILLQIFSILVSGGLLQFVTFLVKRFDNVRKMARVHAQGLKPEHTNILFATEKELVKNVLKYQEEIGSLKTRLRTCKRDLAEARRQDN
jgi:hypothetical protein